MLHLIHESDLWIINLYEKRIQIRWGATHWSGGNCTCIVDSHFESWNRQTHVQGVPQHEDERLWDHLVPWQCYSTLSLKHGPQLTNCLITTIVFCPDAFLKQCFRRLLSGWSNARALPSRDLEVARLTFFLNFLPASPSHVVMLLSFPFLPWCSVVHEGVCVCVMGEDSNTSRPKVNSTQWLAKDSNK